MFLLYGFQKLTQYYKYDPISKKCSESITSDLYIVFTFILTFMN